MTPVPSLHGLQQLRNAPIAATSRPPNLLPQLQPPLFPNPPFPRLISYSSCGCAVLRICCFADMPICGQEIYGYPARGLRFPATRHLAAGHLHNLCREVYGIRF